MEIFAVTNVTVEIFWLCVIIDLPYYKDRNIFHKLGVHNQLEYYTDMHYNENKVIICVTTNYLHAAYTTVCVYYVSTIYVNKM